MNFVRKRYKSEYVPQLLSTLRCCGQKIRRRLPPLCSAPGGGAFAALYSRSSLALRSIRNPDERPLTNAPMDAAAAAANRRRTSIPCGVVVSSIRFVREAAIDQDYFRQCDDCAGYLRPQLLVLHFASCAFAIPKCLFASWLLVHVRPFCLTTDQMQTARGVGHS